MILYVVYVPIGWAIDEVAGSIFTQVSDFISGMCRVALVTSMAIFVTHTRNSFGFVWVSAIIALGPLP